MKAVRQDMLSSLWISCRATLQLLASSTRDALTKNEERQTYLTSTKDTMLQMRS